MSVVALQVWLATLAACLLLAASVPLGPSTPWTGLKLKKGLRTDTQVSVPSGGKHQQYSLYVGGSELPWLKTGHVSMHSNGRKFSTGDSSLDCSDCDSSTGEDMIGKFEESACKCVANSTSDSSQTARMTTIIRNYPANGVVYFQQFFPDGVQLSKAGSDDDVATGFPSFVMPQTEDARESDGVPLGWVTFNGNMGWDIQAGKFSSTASIPGGMAGGLPLVFVDESMTGAVVFSPMTNMLSASQARVDDQIAFGVMGGARSIPAGYMVDFVAVADVGVNEAFARWGSLLRQLHGKPEERKEQDITNTMLGYYTDNGAWTYYNPEKGKSYQQTMEDVKINAVKQGIPYAYLQLDSWWYFKAEDRGVKNWTAIPEVFPDGLAKLHSTTGYGFVAHNRYWAVSTDYATSNGGAFHFEFDGNCGVPNDPKFWPFLLQQAQKWGLLVYEQDWLDYSTDHVKQLREDVFMAENWLNQMGIAANEIGMAIQYCMPYPRHVLHSVKVTPVTQIRVSDDYHPANDQWRIGITSLLAHSLGAAPFKDTFWTERKEPGNPKYKVDVEPRPELETVVATLSRGPVGPSDKFVDQNVTLILGTCDANGKLLRPSRPATAINAQFVAKAFGATARQTELPDGEVWDAVSVIDGYQWHHVLSINLKNAFALRPSALNSVVGNLQSEKFVTSSWNDGLNVPLTMSEDRPITLTPVKERDFQLHVVAPIVDSKFVLLGELGKITSISPDRILAVRPTQDDFALHVRGFMGEKVTMRFVNTESAEIVDILCIFNSVQINLVSPGRRSCGPL